MTYVFLNVSAMSEFRSLFFFFGRQINMFIYLQGAGTDEKVLIEILATRNNQELQAINQAYQEGEPKKKKHISLINSED